ncbi:hypothetical protein LBW59_23200 [Ralstonia solanacearum]|uniref:Uncharacterized protein n=1 Tax=Ralstonia solanacearum TaxID=305 RepID=A0AAW5ZWV2_RALSL|nr:hypothetical protein [Ralstonia solanacearum]MDB0573660.1 hypothetical protein [Ralstonia solanacearum]
MAYNINPIYPPTQDVQVGDIYAYRTDQTGTYGNLFRAIKLDYVPMLAELEAHYRDRPIFPETTAAPAVVSMRRPHGKRSAQARSWKPGRRHLPSGARERWKPVRGETPQRA